MPRWRPSITAVGPSCPGIPACSLRHRKFTHPLEADKASFFDWSHWVLSELLEDAAEWQTTSPAGVLTRPVASTRRYNLDLAPDVMRRLGVLVPDQDVTGSGSTQCGRWTCSPRLAGLAARIDFEHPDGLDQLLRATLAAFSLSPSCYTARLVAGDATGRSTRARCPSSALPRSALQRFAVLPCCFCCRPATGPHRSPPDNLATLSRPPWLPAQPDRPTADSPAH
jgi:hypothetical protein